MSHDPMYEALLDVLTVQEIHIQSMIDAMTKAGIMRHADPSSLPSENFSEIRQKTHRMFQTYLHGHQTGELPM